MRHYKADYLLVHNIRALLAARKVDAKTLAFSVGHSQAWISKILNGDRKVRLVDIDAIADFFGLTCSQLLAPGISAVTERRRHERRVSADRRSGKDRRRVAADPFDEASWRPPERAGEGKREETG